MQALSGIYGREIGRFRYASGRRYGSFASIGGIDLAGWADRCVQKGGQLVVVATRRRVVVAQVRELEPLLVAAGRGVEQSSGQVERDQRVGRAVALQQRAVVAAGFGPGCRTGSS